MPRPAVPVFAVVSRLVPQKGVDWCLRALARLPRGAARLQIVGDGPERDRLETLARELGIAEEVALAALDELLGETEPSDAASLSVNLDRRRLLGFGRGTSDGGS